MAEVVAEVVDPAHAMAHALQAWLARALPSAGKHQFISTKLEFALGVCTRQCIESVADLVEMAAGSTREERIAALMGIGFVKIIAGKIVDAVVAEAEHAPALPAISPAEMELVDEGMGDMPPEMGGPMGMPDDRAYVAESIWEQCKNEKTGELNTLGCHCMSWLDQAGQKDIKVAKDLHEKGYVEGLDKLTPDSMNMNVAMAPMLVEKCSRAATNDVNKFLRPSAKAAKAAGLTAEDLAALLLLEAAVRGVCIKPGDFAKSLVASRFCCTSCHGALGVVKLAGGRGSLRGGSGSIGRRWNEYSEGLPDECGEYAGVAVPHTAKACDMGQCQVIATHCQHCHCHCATATATANTANTATATVPLSHCHCHCLTATATAAGVQHEIWQHVRE